MLIKITVGDLLDNCDANLLIGNRDLVIYECFVDSRKVTDGSCFFGIKGDKVDGSSFYEEAFKNGAKICVLSKVLNLDLNDYKDKTIIISNDVKKVLQDLAAYKRSLFKNTVIGITGSVGKTSTKDMIASVLSYKYKVLKTSGNENSQIGLPITILRLTDEDVMVLEMGMSHANEMHNLSMIAKPDIAVITNVFDSHIGNLGSRENILKAKMEIIGGMNDGTLIINNDNDMLSKIQDVKLGVNVMSFGIDNKSNVMASNIEENIKTSFDIDDIKGFEIMGEKALVYNALPAYLIGKLLGVSRSMIKLGINSYKGEKHRLEVIKLRDNITLIDDSYNASYDSIKVALDYLDKFDGEKIVILGDVLELGNKSKETHKKIGELVKSKEIDKLITIGKTSKIINKISKKPGKHFKNELKSRNYIPKLLGEECTILVKGSNGINLVNIVEYIKKKVLS